jgi:Fe-S oxidoreductase
MVAAPVQLALRPLRTPGRLVPSVGDPAPLEPGRLTWAQLLDAATCVRCGRCTAVCPATAAGKPLDPRQVVQATLQAMREDRPLETLVGPEEAWSCTTCAACVRACPFEIEVLDKLVDLRRVLVERGAVDAAAARALEATVERGNPFNGAPADRVAWAADLEVRVLRPGEATDVLYWVGCAGAYDPHGRRIARATARLLQAAGVDFAILGSAETCTGDPARRIGDETAFREAAGRVALTLGGVRFRRLVTHCAHCFNVFRNELGPAANGAALPAAHHTEFLAELVRAGRLAPRAATAEPVTLHDPCYLARHNGETAAPRAVLASARGGPLEMPRNGIGTFCCGAGGGGAWVEVRQGSRIAALRMAEARETGARVVATACPFCALMLAGETQPGDVAVRDVAELLWESQPAGAAGAGGIPPDRP